MKPETFRKLLEAGLSNEQMAVVLEVLEEQEQQNSVERSSAGKAANKAPKLGADVSEFRKELFPILNTEQIDAIVELRRKKKAALTAYAGRLLATALNSCPNIAFAADEMILRNWTSIKPEWIAQRQGSFQQAERKKTLVEAIDDRQEKRSASLFDSLRTIDLEVGSERRNDSKAVVCFPTNATRHQR